MAYSDHRILSRPLRVHWAGWETDTYSLQKAGWKLSAEQDYSYGRMRIAMKHDGADMVAISETLPFNFGRAIEDRDFHSGYLAALTIRMKHVGREVPIVIHGEVKDWSFAAIDAQPRVVSSKIVKLEDLAHFAAPLVRTNEIIIPEESVDQLMEKILKLQQPARMERIRREIRDEGAVLESLPEEKFVAQIITFGQRRAA